MAKSSVELSKNNNPGSISTYYYKQLRHKIDFTIGSVCYSLIFCSVRTLLLKDRSCGMVYNLYRASLYVGYGYRYLTFYFTEGDVVFLGRTTRVRRVLFPRYVEGSRLSRVLYSRIKECLHHNRPVNMSYYFLTLSRGEDIKCFLSRYFYKKSAYRYFSFKEYNSRKGGVRTHEHFIVILPEFLRGYLNVNDKKFSFIEEKNLGKVINYCKKSLNIKSIKFSRSLEVPRLIRLNKGILDSLLDTVFEMGGFCFFIKHYHNRVGEACVRLGLRLEGGLDCKVYNLKMKKKIK